MGAQGTSLEVKHVILLALLKLNYGSAIKGRRRLHQLVFLAQNKGFEADPLDNEISHYYDFDQSDYGPVSSQIDDSLDDLINDGLVRAETRDGIDDATRFEITAEGSDALDRHREDIEPDEIRILKIVKRLYNEIPLLELFDRFRAQYSEYVTNSRL